MKHGTLLSFGVAGALFAGVLVSAPAIAQTAAVSASTVSDRKDAIRGQMTKNASKKAGAVRLRLWPEQAYLTTLPDGTRFDTLDLEPVATDPQGQFAVTLPEVIDERYIDDSGSINVELVATDYDTATLTNMSVTRLDESTGEVLGKDAKGKKVKLVASGSRGQNKDEPALEELTLDIGPELASSKRKEAQDKAKSEGKGATDAEGTPGVQSASSLGLTPPPASSGATTTALSLLSGSSLGAKLSQALGSSLVGAIGFGTQAGGPYYTCYNETGARYGNYPARYATIYGTAYAKGRTVYENGTSSTLGVGYKAYGGSWGSAGTEESVNNGSGYNTNYTIADAHVANNIHQRYYYVKCRNLSTGFVETNTTTKSDGFAGGPVFTQAAHVNYAYCQPAYGGVEYHRYSGTNASFSTGLDLPMINLRSQSGWTSRTELHWLFQRSGKLCGSNTTWTSSARVSTQTP